MLCIEIHRNEARMESDHAQNFHSWRVIPPLTVTTAAAAAHCCHYAEHAHTPMLHSSEWSVDSLTVRDTSGSAAAEDGAAVAYTSAAAQSALQCVSCAAHRLRRNSSVSSSNCSSSEGHSNSNNAETGTASTARMVSHITVYAEL